VAEEAGRSVRYIGCLKSSHETSHIRTVNRAPAARIGRWS
jgi:hypothetical protein